MHPALESIAYSASSEQVERKFIYLSTNSDYDSLLQIHSIETIVFSYQVYYFFRVRWGSACVDDPLWVLNYEEEGTTSKEWELR